MDYEKKYKEALAKARHYYLTGEGEPVDFIKMIFPELAESEGEKIRQFLIHEIEETSDKIMSYRNMNKKDVLAWLEKQSEPVEINPTEFDTRLQALIGKFDSLPKEELIGSLSFWMNVVQNDGTYKDEEKQGEQKPIIEMKTPEESLNIDSKIYNEIVNDCIFGEDKPKFKVGDWILIDNPCQIKNIKNNGNYIVRYCDAEETHLLSRNFCDSHFHLWTIQDAKDGDVLVYRNTVTEIIMLFKSWVVDREAAYTHFHIFDNDFRVNDSCDCGNGAHPATKEQRDLLFQKMKEAGYEWNTEKKELNKISQRMISAEAKEAMYSKPTDLEEFINELSKQFPDVSFAKLSRIAVRVAKWAKPTDKEMKDLLRTEYEKGRADTIAEMHWSEEDNKWIENLIQTFKDGYLEGFNQLKSYGIISWLKSLKERL